LAVYFVVLYSAVFNLSLYDFSAVAPMPSSWGCSTIEQKVEQNFLLNFFYSFILWGF
jgi:hypothetical protein